jgi:hypothetical protein
MHDYLKLLWFTFLCSLGVYPIVWIIASILKPHPKNIIRKPSPDSQQQRHPTPIPVRPIDNCTTNNQSRYSGNDSSDNSLVSSHWVPRIFARILSLVNRRNQPHAKRTDK